MSLNTLLRRVAIWATVIAVLVVVYQASEGARNNFRQGTTNTICMLSNERC